LWENTPGKEMWTSAAGALEVRQPPEYTVVMFPIEAEAE